jgi:murein DD-endopeptidase MepM/ murein hydrolase activator NlpD
MRVAALFAVIALLPAPGEVGRPFVPPPGPYAAGHRGVDLTAEAGDEVRAALPGRVRFAGRVGGAGWVTVDHGGGLETTYGRLDPVLVPAGRSVRGGDVLGRLAPGAAHVDWGARLDGRYIDPLSLLGPWEPYLTG